MACFLILAQSEYTAAALKSSLALMGESLEGDAQGAIGAPRMIIWKERGGIEEGGVLAYENLVKQIEQEVNMEDGSIALNSVVVLVDSVDPGAMSAVSERGDWSHLIAMLILTFPEIKWIFGVVAGESSGFPATEHSILGMLTRSRRDPLLDPTGLRNWVRRQTNEALKDQTNKTLQDKPDFQIPTRPKKAAAIDEEKGYAYFHGYTAYRYGFLADTVTSWALMEELFGGDEKDETPHGYSVLLEDMSLNFPDKPAQTHLSYLSREGKDNEPGRAKYCPKLNSYKEVECSEHRLLITTGQTVAGAEQLSANRKYLQGKKKVQGRGEVLLKPVGGMLDLWRRGKLTKAEGFAWPPQVSGPLRGRAMRHRGS